MLLPVILCGGRGTRLWPLSRDLYPKQLLPLAGELTMLQQTIARLKGLEQQPPLLLCNEEHRFMVAEQMRRQAVTPRAIVLEPVGRNTAPAIAVAALHAVSEGDDPVLLVLPADHVFFEEQPFRDAVESALPLARAGEIITFGINPDRPETGYGYIKAGASLGGNAAVVERFVEKPDEPTAQRFLEEGGYFWNSGMFLFQASRYLDELARHAPDILDACRAAFKAEATDLDFVRLDAEAFAACRDESIDYAIMEKVDRAVVIPLHAGWSDLGSFSALHQAAPRDAANTAAVGDVITEDVSNSYLRSDHRLLAAVGVDNIVAVETSDAVLIASMDRVQDVKKIVSRLKADGREEATAHSRVYRPWGDYESIDHATRYQVKRITVKPGAALSLQMHHHRSEHWVVVSGTAKVIRDDEELILKEDQSIYIPLGARHRLENPGRIPLELIEVQTGAYLGEDDIVRFEDVYGRVKG